MPDRAPTVHTEQKCIEFPMQMCRYLLFSLSRLFFLRCVCPSTCNSFCRKLFGFQFFIADMRSDTFCPSISYFYFGNSVQQLSKDLGTILQVFRLVCLFNFLFFLNKNQEEDSRRPSSVRFVQPPYFFSYSMSSLVSLDSFKRCK